MLLQIYNFLLVLKWVTHFLDKYHVLVSCWDADHVQATNLCYTFTYKTRIKQNIKSSQYDIIIVVIKV